MVLRPADFDEVIGPFPVAFCLSFGKLGRNLVLDEDGNGFDIIRKKREHVGFAPLRIGLRRHGMLGFSTPQALSPTRFANQASNPLSL